MVAGAVASLGLLGCQRFEADTPVPAPAQVTPTAIPSPQASTKFIDRIVYVGSDFHIYTINPDGTDRQLISGDTQFLDEGSSDQQTEVFFGWPSWSPDGASILFSAFSPQAQQPGAALISTDLRGRDPTRVFTNPAGPITLVAQDSPHYALWSPDGSYVAFLAGDQEGLVLYLAAGSGEGEAQRVAAGAPLYLAWAHDSRSLLLHWGTQLLRVSVDAPGAPARVGAASPGYRAPAGSPTTDLIAYVDADEAGRGSLYTARFDGSGRTPLAQTDGFSSFLWAPQGDRIAIGQSRDPADPFLQEVQVVDVATQETVSLVTREAPVMAFFWSPDGSKIALVTPNASRNALQWEVVDSRTGATMRVVEFIPSSDLLMVLAFFDQYAYSHQVWSPDSRYLVFTGSLAGAGSGAGQGRRVSQVFVVDVERSLSPVPLDDGFLASWSLQ